MVESLHVLACDLLMNGVLDAPFQKRQFFDDARDTSEVEVKVRFLQEGHLDAANDGFEAHEGFHHHADLGLEFYIRDTCRHLHSEKLNYLSLYGPRPKMAPS